MINWSHQYSSHFTTGLSRRQLSFSQLWPSSCTAVLTEPRILIRQSMRTCCCGCTASGFDRIQLSTEQANFTDNVNESCGYTMWTEITLQHSKLRYNLISKNLKQKQVWICLTKEILHLKLDVTLKVCYCSKKSIKTGCEIHWIKFTVCYLGMWMDDLNASLASKPLNRQ